MNAAPTMHGRDWLLLLFLSLLWGCSFFFNQLALRELPPLSIAFMRVFLAALMLLPCLKWSGERLPRTLRGYLPFFVMGLLNNVIPFWLVLVGQTYISSGLASVLNATTPLFSVLVLGSIGDEKLQLRRVVAVLIGLGGVLILRDPDLAVTADQTLGMLLCLAAALSYSLSGLWGRRNLLGISPLVSSATQLVCSSVTWLSLISIAGLSTALAYIVFFRILIRSGATNVMLVTLLIPVTAILLGYLALGEPLSTREILGALVIGSALIVIDGRIFGWLMQRPAPI